MFDWSILQWRRACFCLVAINVWVFRARWLFLWLNACARAHKRQQQNTTVPSALKKCTFCINLMVQRSKAFPYRAAVAHRPGAKSDWLCAMAADVAHCSYYICDALVCWQVECLYVCVCVPDRWKMGGERGMVRDALLVCCQQSNCGHICLPRYLWPRRGGWWALSLSVYRAHRSVSTPFCCKLGYSRYGYAYAIIQWIVFICDRRGKPSRIPHLKFNIT